MSCAPPVVRPLAVRYECSRDGDARRRQREVDVTTASRHRTQIRPAMCRVREGHWMVLDASVVDYVFPQLVCVVGVVGVVDIVVLLSVCVKLMTCVGEGERDLVVAVLDTFLFACHCDSGRVRLIRERARK